MAAQPTLAGILARSLGDAPRETRRRLGWLAGTWACMFALQLWDVRDRHGPEVWAEMASVILLTSGTLLVACMHILGAADAAAGPAAPALRQVVLALPTLGFAASGLLAAGMATLVARVMLGASPILLGILAINLVVLVAAARATNTAALLLYRHAEEQAAAASRAEARTAEARLAALQAQMNPHFLFNALNTVAALVPSDPRAAVTTVEELSDVLRRTLERTRTTGGTVADEIDYVRSYVAVESRRFGDRLRMEWAIAPEAERASLPALAIQPLVENAIRHAIAPRRVGGRIRVTANVAGGRLRVAVEDDGEGFSGRAKEGTGLSNLRARLATLYGGAASLAIESSAAGTCAVVETPLRTIEADLAAPADR